MATLFFMFLKYYGFVDVTKKLQRKDDGDHVNQFD
jgi:hypothetical protein